MMALKYAADRWYRLTRNTFAILGMIMLSILAAPGLELKFAPPVSAWGVVDAKRTGDTLTWFVYVEKKRNCSSTIRWLARWGEESTPLRATWADETQSNGQAVRVPAGVSGKYGPLTAKLPPRWKEVTDPIIINAHVVYDCGTPWILPPVPVQEVTAR